MGGSSKKKLPQAGTAAAGSGESRTPSASAGRVCPTYSGGGNLTTSASAPPDASGNENNKEMDEDDGVSDSTISSMETVTSMASTATGRKRPSEKRSPVSLSDDGHDFSSGEEKSIAPTISSGPGKRGRGRPPTTGEYVGLAKAKSEYLKVKRDELDLATEAELSQFIKEMDAQRSALAFLPADELRKEVGRSVEAITRVATKSRNMKGTFVKALKEAAETIEKAVGVLHSRTSSEEVETLRAENSCLRTEVDELREELVRLRADVESVRASAPPPVDRSEEFRSRLMQDMAFMMDAKLAGIQNRLLPEERLRPPLRSDTTRGKAQSPVPGPSGLQAAPRNRTTPAGPSAAPDLGQIMKGKGQGKKGGTAAATKPTPAPRTLPPPPESMETPWTTVVKRGKSKGREKGKAKGPTPTTAAPTAQKTVPNRSAAKRRRKRSKLVPPRSAAVVITVSTEAVQEGVTYEKVLSRAREKINLGELGIDGLKFRRAVTGARILEVPGKESASKADQLAIKLREALPANVRVARPTKCVAIRISGLDDSVEKSDVRTAVSAVGLCPVEQVSVGEIWRGLFGNGSVLVRCPIAAAKKLTEGGEKLLVGWSSARVTLVEPRPMRCYRCLEPGHTGSQCDSVDRSNACFRCGKLGHKAATCTDKPHCPACAAVGKPADHHIGSNKCAPKKGRMTAVRTPAAQAQFMETG